jgi:hypothetical protein
MMLSSSRSRERAAGAAAGWSDARLPHSNTLSHLSMVTAVTRHTPGWKLGVAARPESGQ